MKSTLEESERSVLKALSLALELRDLETHGHTERVVRSAVALGRAWNLNAVQLRALEQGAYLHDIGKLTLPDAVLKKPGELSHLEWDVMRSHPERGHGIAARAPGIEADALLIIRHHHERWDGAGYPDRLAGETIPFLVRLFTVCDVYDALRSDRVYKKAWSAARAAAELRRQAGRQLDPKVVARFLDVVISVPERLPR